MHIALLLLSKVTDTAIMCGPNHSDDESTVCGCVWMYVTLIQYVSFLFG